MIPKMFQCLGLVSGGTKSFHEKGFLKAQARYYSNSEPCYEINLFGSHYLISSALTEHYEDLFENCRKAFMLLHGNSLGRGLRATTSDDINSHLRSEISKFLNYLLYFLQYGVAIDDDCFLSNLELHLNRLRLLFHKLSLAKLPDHTLAYYASTLGDGCSNPAQHLVHCHLDFRWLFINILRSLEQLKQRSSFSQFTQGNRTLLACVEEEILLLMNELIWLAIVRYEKADKMELAPFPAFSCVCVKELWLLLLHFSYSSQDFWVYFQQTLKVILDNKEPPVIEEYCSLKIIPPDFLPCNNRNEFAIWFLADIARLLEYDSHGEYVGANTSAGDKFVIVDDILRGLLSEDANPSEASMRNILPIVSKIQSSCGHVRSGPVLCLWEYFFKKINSAFYIPGSKLNSNLVLSKSGLSLVEDVKSRLNGSERDKKENSFLMFFRLLGEHLLAGQRSGTSATRLCSRVFVKFSVTRPEKLKEFSEQGIFHLASLYITLAIGSATPNIVNRLVELLSAVPRTDNMKEGKHEMIFKGYEASLIALEDMNGDLSESADFIIKHVDWCLRNQLLKPLVHFVDSLKYLFQKDISRLRGLHHLLQSWISLYLSTCRKTDTIRFLSVFIPLVQKLNPSSGNYISEGQQLRTKVESFLIPHLSEHESLTTAELAGFCSLCLSRHRMELFRYWCEREDCAISAKFLAVIIRHGGENTNNQFPQLGNYVQFMWARCCFLWGSNEDTKSLSSCLRELPQASTIKIDWNGQQPFKDFIDFFGVEYSFCQNLLDKSSLRNLFLSYFSKFDKWIDNKCKNLEELEGDVTQRFYEYSSYLFKRCPHLIYTKSNPHCLLKSIMDNLILPRQIYKREYKIPQNVFAAITHYLDQFISGLLELDAERDPYIGRLLRDVVSNYLGRFRNMPVESNPLLLALKENPNSFILSILKMFLKVQNGSIGQNADNVLQLLQASIQSEVPKTNIIFQETIDDVMELFILIDDLHPIKAIALNYISTACLSECNRKRMFIVLSDSCKKYMAFNASAWFNAAKRIAPLCRSELAPLIPVATQVIEEIEKRRGVENDASLRRMLQILELSVG